jgi:hypothetical protein
MKGIHASGSTRDNTSPDTIQQSKILDILHELTVEGIERKMVDYTEEELKHLTVAHIAKHYPTPEWIHMYTDGSAPGEGNAGAGVYSVRCISTSLASREICAHYVQLNSISGGIC